MTPRSSLLSLAVIAVGCTVCARLFSGDGSDPQGGGLSTLQEGAGQDTSQIEPERITPVVRAVQKAAPSVVSIHTRAQVQGGTYWPGKQDTLDGEGSGVIVDKDGLVITNWHVIWNQTGDPGFNIKVILYDGSEHIADLVSESPQNDLALLKIRDAQGKQFQPVVMGNSSSLMIGETLIAIGNPRGQARSVTVGVLSAIDRTIQVPWPNGRPHTFDHLLQTDAAVNPGNSGGALLDITGKLIGINNAIRTDATGINFAIPVDKVRQVFNEVLLSYDGSGKFWLGMRVNAAPKADGGVVVSTVEKVGPAAEAGLRSGDQILAVNGRPIASHVDFAKQLLDMNPGQQVKLKVRRGSDARDMAFALGSAEDAATIRFTGMLVRAVTADTDKSQIERATAAFLAGRRARRSFALPVVFEITSVLPDGPAKALGLAKGDVIFATRGIDRNFGQMVNIPFQGSEVTALVDRLRECAGSQMTVLVLRGDKRMEGELVVRDNN